MLEIFTRSYHDCLTVSNHGLPYVFTRLEVPSLPYTSKVFLVSKTTSQYERHSAPSQWRDRPVKEPPEYLAVSIPRDQCGEGQPVHRSRTVMVSPRKEPPYSIYRRNAPVIPREGIGAHNPTCGPLLTFTPTIHHSGIKRADQMYTFTYRWNGERRTHTTDDRLSFEIMLEVTFGIYFYDVTVNR